MDPLRPGRETTEHGRAARAEAVALCLALLGLVMLAGELYWQGIALEAIGCGTLAIVAESYTRRRCALKTQYHRAQSERDIAIAVQQMPRSRVV